MTPTRNALQPPSPGEDAYAASVSWLELSRINRLPPLTQLKGYLELSPVLTLRQYRSLAAPETPRELGMEQRDARDDVSLPRAQQLKGLRAWLGGIGKKLQITN